MKEIVLLELEYIFGGSIESYDAGKRHGEALREAVDNCAAIGVILFIISRGRIKI